MSEDRNIYYLIQKNSVIDICDTIRKSIGSINPIQFPYIPSIINNLTYESKAKRIKTGLIGMRDVYSFNTELNIEDYSPSIWSGTQGIVNRQTPNAIIKLKESELSTLSTEELDTEKLCSLPFSDPVYGYWNNSSKNLYFYAPYNNITFVERCGNFFSWGNKCMNFVNFNMDTLFYYVDTFMWGGIHCFPEPYIPSHATTLAFAANAEQYRGNYVWKPEMIPETTTNIFSICPGSWGVPSGQMLIFSGIPNGSNIINMAQAFCEKSYLYGEGWSGPNVVNMAYAYKYCHNLYGNAYIGDNVINAYNAYTGCENLNGKAYCGNNVINFVYCFNECRNLKEGSLSNSIVNAHSGYYGCWNLTNMEMQEQFTNLLDASNLFSYCNNLTGDINFSNSYNLTNICNILLGAGSIGPNVKFDNCYNLVSVSSIISDDSSYHPGLQNLKYISMTNCTNLTELKSAFYNCNYVTDLNLYGCTNLQKVNFSAFPNLQNLNVIGTQVNNLAESFIGSHAETINLLWFQAPITNMYNAFQKCDNLSYLNFESISYIDNLYGTFSGSDKIINNLRLDFLPELNDISYMLSNMNNTETISISNVNNVTKAEGLVAYSSSLKSVDFTNLTNLEHGNNLCNGCKNLESVILPTDFTGNLYYGFRDCSNLTSITPKPKLNKLNSIAFIYLNCTSLPTEYLQLPDDITDARGVFYGCSQLTGDIAMSDNIVNAKSLYLGTHINSITLGNNVYNIPYMLENAYLLTNVITYNNNYGDISYLFGNCKNLQIDQFQIDNALTLCGAFYNIKGINKININSATPIHNLNFAFWNTNVITAEMPIYNLDSKINNLAMASVFCNCTCLEGNFEFNIGYDNTPFSAGHAFRNCYKVEKVEIVGNSNNANFYCTFYEARNLKSVKVPEVLGGSTSLLSTFYNCYSLVENAANLVTNLATTSTTTSNYMFYGCNNVYGPPAIPPNVSSIVNMYRHCQNIGGDIIWSTDRYSCSKMSTANMVGCFYNRGTNPKRINIYVNAGSSLNTNLYNRGNGCRYLCGSSTSSLASYKWILATGSKCYYNTVANIYVYYTK